MANKNDFDIPDSEPDAKVEAWLGEIESGKKREKDYRADGKKILSIYEGEEKEKVPFNILFSNTETLLPALYSSVPRPVVQRRFKDGDPIGKASAKAGEHILEFLLDTNISGYETFDDCMKAAALDGLLPGRGINTIKYEAEMLDVDGSEANEDGDVEQEVKTELVCMESRVWNRVIFGYAKKWSNMPWIAYEEYIDKDEATRLFGKDIAGKLRYTAKEQEDGDDEEKDDQQAGELSKVTCVYQIWYKKEKKILYVSPQYKDGFLKESGDTLGLTGFFNMPKPIRFIEKSNNLLPTPVYNLYEEQAKELNQLTRRIQKVVEAVKARGIYDSELGADIANIMENGDNTLVPADKTASLAAEKGLANAIWFMPIEQLVNVLIQLYAARNQCKQIIYEITGISDIMRGATNAHETLGAQEIKKSFGTLRLKRMQGEVQRYARDCLRMMLEIASTKFSEETWAKMTGLPYHTKESKEQVTRQIQLLQTQQQEIPQPLQDQAQLPMWSEVLAMLKDDVQRAYRIDIESNTTVQPEATEDQKNIAEVMNALAQYMNGVAPLVSNGSLPFEAAQSMMLAISRRFRFGSEIEEHILKMKAPEKEDPKQAEAAKQQADMQAKQAEAEIKGKAKEVELQAESAKFQAEKQFEAMTQDKDIQAKKELQVEELASKERIAKSVAQISANAQLATAKMKNSDGASSIKLLSSDFPDGVPEELQEEVNMNDAEKNQLSEAIAMLARAIQTMSQPKETIITERDEEGRAISSVQRTVTDTVQ